MLQKNISMASYTDLVDSIVMMQKLRSVERGGRYAPKNKANLPFNEVLRKTMEQRDQKVLQGVPFRRDLTGNINILPANEAMKFEECLKFVLEKEGSRYVREDGGKESSRYGILQSTAEGFGYKGNVRDITKTEVEMVYRKIWDQSGAGSLPFPLCLVHFDTYVNSPAMAKKLLSQSSGDVDTYLRLREQRYVKLASLRPEVYGKYLQGWKNRVDSLRNMVASHKGTGTVTRG